MSRDMPVKALWSLMLAVAMVLGSQAHAALFDAYLEMDGFKASTVVEGKPGLKILGSSFNSGAPTGILISGVSGGGGGAGKAQCDSIQIDFDANDFATMLFLHSMNQKHITTATVTYYEKKSDTSEKYFTIKLTDVLVSSFAFAHSGDEQPHSRATLNFTKIQIEQFDHNKPAGQASWDVKANIKL